MQFPRDFVWGASTSSYQIEGACRADGKGLSVWDHFCTIPGKILGSDTGEVACDHYRRYREDVALMKDIGLKGYRFSLNWPRILPHGIGSPNSKGVDFYRRLIDQLHQVGIEPFVTLFHWDFPLVLHDRGGWLNPDSPHWFAEYAQTAARELGDGVRFWMTLNEPQSFVIAGHIRGDHAPGHHYSLKEALTVSHHVLLAHGRAVQALRSSALPGTQIGYAPVGVGKYPATECARDIAAARTATFSMQTDGEPWKALWSSTWWMDPVYRGCYPDDGLRFFGAGAPRVGPDDMRVIAEPTDFLGANIYNMDPVKADAETGCGFVQVDFPPGARKSALGWPITPEALYWGPKFLHERYGKPIYITENGTCVRDQPDNEGRVSDTLRVEYLRDYLLALGRSIEHGVDVRGYFHWSLMDNFEWAQGYSARFGLVHVDFTTQKRTHKDSARFYAEIIRAGRVPAGLSQA